MDWETSYSMEKFREEENRQREIEDTETKLIRISKDLEFYREEFDKKTIEQMEEIQLALYKHYRALNHI